MDCPKKKKEYILILSNNKNSNPTVFPPREIKVWRICFVYRRAEIVLINFH